MRLIPVLIAATGFVALSACDVEQTKEGELPDVDVSATEGQLPAYDVDTADVNVTTEERTVEVPVVKVDEADAGDAQ